MDCLLSAPDLYPIPFAALVQRLKSEVAAGGAIYAINRRDWWVPKVGIDVSLHHLGHHLGSPSGPASGPQTQLAQNFVAAWLTGGRFMELKTVQIDDALEIPRPCIFAPNVGYNVEWSQELRVHQSAEEYVKGWMLVHMLASKLGPGLWPGPMVCWDLSLGYDLVGIQSQKVRDFVSSMRDAGPIIARLRKELPPELAEWGAVDVPSQLVNSVTLSTFHGCPADEIESIAMQTLDWGMHTVVKLNPTLLGYERVRRLLDEMGYDFVGLDRAAFDKDLQWPQLMAMLPRLEARARQLDLGFGVKLTNTLVHLSDVTTFDSNESYLSGPPLYVLALSIAGDIRKAMQEEMPNLPITFSAGIQASNFHEVVAAGIGPATSCTDLLKGKGYPNQTRYLRTLESKMEELGVTDIDGFRAAVGGSADPQEASFRTLTQMVETVASDPRYQQETNAKAPKKVGTQLVLLDCLTCDKCIPVCPNLANFTLDVPKSEYAPEHVAWDGPQFVLSPGVPFKVGKRHQIANLIDACNLCGSCDVWCPEDGGPYLVKPHFFISKQAFDDHPNRDGLLVDDDWEGIRWQRGGERIHWRKETGNRSLLQVPGGTVLLSGDVVLETEGSGAVDLGIVILLRLFLRAITHKEADAFRNLQTQRIEESPT